MDIGVPNESARGETRVAATPRTVRQLLDLGHRVLVEEGAGERSAFDDAAYAEAGALVVGPEHVWGGDVVVALHPPTDAQLATMRAGAVLVAFLTPRQEPGLTARLAAQGVTAMSMDMVPRTSRAQSMDALSAMANISGYRAVVEAAHVFGRFFTGQVTAAGKVPPAKVLVAGTGVAGLAAIGAAGAMGAVVRATDVRPETAEQVESMGATFLHVGADDQGVSSDGYAREVGADYAERAARLYAQQAAEVDIIITTAAIPGRPSPRLITAEMVASMRNGSVIVDLAAAGGGNCELTRPGETFITDGGVTIIGWTDLAARLPGQASQLYGTNLVNVLALMTPGKDGRLVVDFDDEIVRTMTVARDGEVTFPPPPIQVSAAPAPAPVAEPAAEPEPPRPKRPWWHQVVAVGVGSLGLVAALTFAPTGFVSLFGIFAVAVVVGYYVVWNVTHALHTPLMSVTNAISGIIIVGAMTQLASDSWLVKGLAFVAVLIASINVFGGFTVTARMLGMFRKG
ncbi:Re/Si-specific NAD(P)(+) transhydrogenase subunit alpha [Tessaracoccus rhinocerotis]|uniref:NAD(P) transhydrogenase subunit alpha n=1 Tax=Tessaracoccus rhinocerotis TaxID=1689449 RepID=A0A553K5K7_9ACTN|nr:Re/Si-specific NAD(P)(+) transhydrogenase subunit alpha [Tessaracoccus rhinocerotis]TRY19990.1 Re/Si-specific NAD(P)(+) transhydrogenase subunit alpha [Tessaracoccus rhinocerotis]